MVFKGLEVGYDRYLYAFIPIVYYALMSLKVLGRRLPLFDHDDRGPLSLIALRSKYAQ